MTGADATIDRVHAYGEAAARGVEIECADCGLLRELSGETLPACPRYSDATHPRAGWLMLPSEKPGSVER